MLASPLAMTPELLSLTGKRWVMREADLRQVTAIVQKTGVPEIVARLLAGRGVTTETAESFLNPTLRESLPDPFHLKDMRKAAERIADEVTGYRLQVTKSLKPVTSNLKPTIAIFGDYDVDGATSSALLVRYFRALGIEPLVYIPDRMKEGYGPNAAALLQLKEQGASLVITVDCGTLAFAPLEVAKEAGLDVIVVDHHKGEPELPQAYAVVNPNRFDETSVHGQLAAVGVAFLLCVAVNAVLRERKGAGSWVLGSGDTSTQHPAPSTPLPDLLPLLDLVALGTICDVVSLTGVNRTLVAQGLKVMAQRTNPGIAALMDVAKLDEKPGTYHAGFIIGPRINAGGRVGQSDLGVRILTGSDASELRQIAQQLDQYNAERKAIESGVLEQAMLQAEQVPATDAAILVASEGWHPGVIGIVAGRLKDKFHKPTAVIALSGGIGKASARSVPGIDIGNAVLSALKDGLLVAGGGHAMAAGFTVAEAAIPRLRDFLNRDFAARMAAASTVRTLWIDAPLTIPAANATLARLIEQAGPYGAGNPAPHFMLTDVRVIKADVVGENHLRVILGDGAARLTGQGASLKAIAFRCADTLLGQALQNARGKTLHVAGSVKLNVWNGRESADFVIEDAAWA